MRINTSYNSRAVAGLLAVAGVPFGKPFGKGPLEATVVPAPTNLGFTIIRIGED